MTLPPLEQLLATHKLASRAMDEGDFLRARAVLQLLDTLLSSAAGKSSGDLRALHLDCLADLCECEVKLDHRSEAAATLRRALALSETDVRDRERMEQRLQEIGGPLRDG